MYRAKRGNNGFISVQIDTTESPPTGLIFLPTGPCHGRVMSHEHAELANADIEDKRMRRMIAHSFTPYRC